MKPFSIYFPQFYPTNLNDSVWGHGFTDWSLVANANLTNRWHRRAPKKGFYNGADREVHNAQIQEMKDFGLGGIALYHYWFFDRHELNAFESNILDYAPNFPWFLIWATENWSKRWIGDSTEILSLNDSPSDWEIINHCDYLVTCFESPDYLKIDNKPFFLIYNLSHFRNPELVIYKYRLEFSKRGYEICLGYFIKNPFEIKYSNLVDISYLFEPRLFFGFQRVGRNGISKSFHDKFKSIFGSDLTGKLIQFLDNFQQKGKSYDQMIFLEYFNSIQRENLIKKIKGNYQNVISPSWNNTPRYNQNFTAIENLGPSEFLKLISHSLKITDKFPLLINAWNEWSEGAAIEPCAYLGNLYLDVIVSSNSEI